MEDYRHCGDGPVIKNDSMMLKSFGNPWSHLEESDDSEDEEVSPTEEFWSIPEDEWTVVDRSHRKPRNNNSNYRSRTHNPSGKLDNIGMRYDDLDNIIDTKVLSCYRKEVGWIADTFPKITTDIETVIVNVKPIVKKQTDRLKKASVDRSDSRDDCPVNLVLTPRARERQIVTPGHRL